MFHKIVRTLQVFEDYLLYSLRANNEKSLVPLLQDIHLCLYDQTDLTGFDRHYIYFPAWAARIIKKSNPSKHVDIASSLTFSTMISAYIPTEFYDYRPARITLTGLRSKHADVTNLPFRNNSIESLSCMHVLEHIGLGRYGDIIDPSGDVRGANELIRVISVGGRLLIVVPVGRDKIKFNAHRIYSYKSVIKLFSPLKLVESYLIPDDENKDPIYNPKQNIFDKQKYACGCFVFKKEKAMNI